MPEGRLHLPIPGHVLNWKSSPFPLAKNAQDYAMMQWNYKAGNLSARYFASLGEASKVAAEMWKVGHEHKPIRPADLQPIHNKYPCRFNLYLSI